MHKPLLPRGSETTAKQSGSAFKVFNKAETGTDMPDTNIHYYKVIAKSSCKIALSWPIPYSLIVTKKSIQFVVVTMKITDSKMYRSEWLRKKNPICYKKFSDRFKSALLFPKIKGTEGINKSYMSNNPLDGVKICFQE